jgi:hypothetical protein
MTRVRFYVDIPSQGVRVAGAYGWPLLATTTPSSGVLEGFTRVAFDVDMPSNLVLPPHDLMAPSEPAVVLEKGKA